MSQVLAEELACRALRDWLLLQLPAKVAAVNLTRAAVLRAPYAGPYVFSAGATLGINQTANSDAFSETAFATGSQTTAQVVTAINAAMGAVVASSEAVNADGTLTRLVLTSTTPPLSPDASALSLRGGVNGSDANVVFGWDAGGEKVTTTALVAPGSRGVCNGLPLQPDFGPSGQGGGSPIVVIIGDRSSRPVAPVPRRDEYLVSVEMAVLRIEPQQQVHRDREHIHAAVRCVREVLLTDAGRMLGRSGFNDVVLVSETRCKIAALPFKFIDNKNAPVVSPLFDGAEIMLDIRIFERPGAT